MKYVKIRILITIMCVVVCLCACGHEHTWTEATCEAPKTCSECGETEGEALGHDYEEATCEEAKTCDRCGVKEGEALGHQWIEATFENPQTCTVCGATMGEKYEYVLEENELFFLDDDTVIFDMTDYLNLSEFGDSYPPDISDREVMPGWMYMWKYYEYVYDVQVTHKAITEDGKYEVYIVWYNIVYDGGGEENFYYCLVYEDKELVGCKSIYELGAKDAYTSDNKSYYKPWVGLTGINGDIELMIINYDSTNYWDELIIVDTTFTEKFRVGMQEYSHIEFSCVDDWHIKLTLSSEYSDSDYKFYDSDYNEIDCADGEAKKELLLASGKYTYVSHRFDDVFFVGNDDEWGYVDSDDNVIAMYLDATVFNADGYAFVSNDRISYDLIDRDFNVCIKDAIQANSMYCYDGECFAYKKEGDDELNPCPIRVVKIDIIGGPGDGKITAAPKTDEASSDDTQISEETSGEKSAEALPDGIIVFDWNPEEISFLGHKMEAGIIDDLMEEYGFPEGADYLEKKLDEENTIAACSYSYENNDETVTSRSISINSKDGNNTLTVNENNGVISISSYSQNGNVDGIIELADKYLTIPLLCGKEEDVEKVFHVREILDKSDFINPNGLPFESNYEGSRISESVYEGDSDRDHLYIIEIGNLNIYIRASSGDPSGLEYYFCSYNLKIK